MVEERPATDRRDRRIARRVKAEPSLSPSRSPSQAPETVSDQALPVSLAAAWRADQPEPENVVLATAKALEALDLILVNPGTHMDTLLMLYRKIRLTVEAREDYFEQARAA